MDSAFVIKWKRRGNLSCVPLVEADCLSQGAKRTASLPAYPVLHDEVNKIQLLKLHNVII
jgi:hypothetical protein